MRCSYIFSNNFPFGHLCSWSVYLTSTLVHFFILLTVPDSLTWFSQELNGAVTKINDLIRQRSSVGQHANHFVLDQNDIPALGLGISFTLLSTHFLFLTRKCKINGSICCVGNLTLHAI